MALMAGIVASGIMYAYAMRQAGVAITPPTFPVSGYAMDATNKSGLAGVSVIVDRNQVAMTDGNGMYNASLPEGNFTLVFRRSGYSDASRVFAVQGSADAFLSPKLPEGQCRFVLRWGSTPRDLDLHAETESGQTLCSYLSKSSPSAVLDVDSRQGYGPETVTVLDPNASIVIKVFRYSKDGEFSSSGAVVDLYDSTGLADQVHVPESAFNGADWWVVGKVHLCKFEVNNTVSY